MKVTSNKDMLNAIRNQASAEYQEKIPAVVEGRAVPGDIWTTLSGYPSLKNEFINTLATKVVRTDFFSKVYENPWKMLKKGMLPYGHSIEELFVQAADAKGFFKADNHDMEEPSELIGVTRPKVDSLYISRNFAYVFKTSISDAQLKSAFTSQNGLSELVNQIVGSLTSGAEQKEYTDMRELLFNIAAGQKTVFDPSGNQDGNNNNIGFTKKEKILSGSPQGVKRYMYTHKISKIDNRKDYDTLSIAIRTLAGQMKFVSDKYNMAGVKTWSRPEDLVFITTPEVVANLDVAVLSQAFNVSMADVNTRTILVDSLPTKVMKNHTDGKGAELDVSNPDSKMDTSPSTCKVYGYLIDKDFLQVIDTLNETRTFDNGRALTQNLFLHKQGMLATCFFANAVAIAAHA